MAVHVPHFISRQLFQCSNVSLYKISQDATSNINNWDLSDSNKIWQGNMRFIEQEAPENYPEKYLSGLTVEKSGEYTTYSVEPFSNLRAKIEFYNRSSETDIEEIWAETWYNPLVSIEYENELKLSETAHLEIKRLHTIAHDKKDTILEVDNSDRHFRVVVQLPGTGYHPYMDKDEYNLDLIQVALGLQIQDMKQAYRFAECLEVYNSRYGYAQHSYYYDRMVYAINSVSLSEETNIVNDSSETVSSSDGFSDSDSPESVPSQNKEKEKEKEKQKQKQKQNTEDSDDDEFGDFVTS